MFVRWEHLTTEQDEAARLPGYRDPAVMRRFDAPEALDMRFYEIHAKSALNRVPKASQMPFQWTINPYRGCGHACVYCMSGETPILMADGRHKPLAKLRVGDEIYGTRRDGRHRRYTRTQVLAHWSSVKPAYRVVLEDGTELNASGDHRFLSARGWRHVTGTDGESARRAHLTIGSELLGTGGFAGGPRYTGDYERGYLCGMIRGDALADDEALERAERYLFGLGVYTRFAVHAGSATARAPAVLPPRGSRDPTQARHRRLGRDVGRPHRRRRDRATSHDVAPVRHHDRHR